MPQPTGQLKRVKILCSHLVTLNNTLGECHHIKQAQMLDEIRNILKIFINVFIKTTLKKLT